MSEGSRGPFGANKVSANEEVLSGRMGAGGSAAATGGRVFRSSLGEVKG